MDHDVLNLEPKWASVTPGSRVDFLAETVVWDPSNLRTLVRSAIHRKFILVEGTISHAPAYSFLGGILGITDNRFSVKVDDESMVLQHSGCTFPDLWNVSEICSGLGAMSDGFLSAGGFVTAKNELREPLVNFQRQQGFQSICTGNIGDTAVLAEFFQLHPQSTMLVAGFNCQPWSKLGDKGQLNDPRSMTLVYALRTAYFCRSHSVMLECVSEAGEDPQVVNLIEQWCRITGFQRSSTCLKLEDFWASRRHRWWCLLVNPAAPKVDLIPLPKQSCAPTVADLLPSMPCWPPSDEEQLSLDLYETNKFIEFGSFDAAIVRSDQPLATALHGWGNQLQGCPCGCRKHPMDHSRLQRKGLFGALIIMEGQLECTAGPRLRSRHIHPWELSVLTGCPPNKNWGVPLRLALCGLGQMASPIHSCWIYAQYKFAMEHHLGLPTVQTPEEALWAHVKGIFNAYLTSFPELYGDKKVAQFVTKTHDLLFDAHINRVIPSQVFFPSVADLLPEQIVVPSQQSADAQDLEVPHHEVLDDGYGGAFIHEDSPDHDTAMESFFEDLQKVQVSSPNTQADSFVAEEVAESPEDQAPFTSTGGFVAFARPSEDVTKQSFSKKRKFEDMVSTEQDKSLGIPALPVLDAASHQPAVTTAVAFDENPVAPHQSLLSEPSDNPRIIQLFLHDSTVPSFIRMPPTSSIKDIVDAEVKLGSIHTPIHIKDAVGGPLSVQKLVESFEQIHLHSMDSYCPADLVTLQDPSKGLISRIALLHQQEGWVAQDEMDFYLGFLDQLDGVGFLPSMVVPVFDPDFDTWLDELLSVADREKCAASAILHDGHWNPIVIWKQDGSLWISTTSFGKSLIDTYSQDILQGCHITLLDLASVFHADCGFQTIGSILQEVLDHMPDNQWNHPPKSFPVRASTAVAWRILFATHLHASDKARQSVEPASFHFGGALIVILLRKLCLLC